MPLFIDELLLKRKGTDDNIDAAVEYADDAADYVDAHDDYADDDDPDADADDYADAADDSDNDGDKVHRQTWFAGKSAGFC